MAQMGMDLRLFDEGGAPAGAAAQGGTVAAQGAVDKAAGQGDAQDVGTAQDGQPQRKTFEELIKGEYKADYESALKSHISRRMKGHDALVQQQKSMEPMLGLLAMRYGKDASDIDGITKALESDQKLFEDEALEKGVTPEHLMQMKRVELENQALQRQIQDYQRQQAAQQHYQQWQAQMAEAKQVFPNIDLGAELKNENFVKLLRANVPIKHAYMVIHQDEVLGGAMQHTAQEVASKVASDIQARGMRPPEIGAGSQSATTQAHKHAKDMSADEIRQIAELAKRGIITPMS